MRIGLLLLCVPLLAADKPRIFVDGEIVTTQARTRTEERRRDPVYLAQQYAKNCPGVIVTEAKERAAYTVQISGALFVIYAANGDLVARGGGTFKNPIKESCKVLLTQAN